MRKFGLKIVIISLLLLLFSFTTNNSKAISTIESNNYDITVSTKSDFRAVWISSLVGDIPKFSSMDQYKREITNILDIMQYYNLNIMIFHIRIMNDAFYESQFNSWSSYYNTNPSWEALPWIIDECHKRGIEFHAWMNPYRVSTSVSTNLQTLSKKFKSSNPASKPENLLVGSDTIILNPGLPIVQTFLVSTVMEVVKKYDVDAIHFDDYFYVDNVDDTATFREYSTIVDVLEWRRNNVSDFIQRLSRQIKSFNEMNNRSVQLGISPTPVYDDGDGEVTYDENGTAITNGSKTSYGGHYDDYHCCDTKMWIDKEWIDYIIPQCYPGTSAGNKMFYNAIDWWDKVVKYKKVNLYVGVGIYRAEKQSDWKDSDELKKQFDYMYTKENVQGYSLFCYKNIKTAYNSKTSIYATQMNNIKDDYLNSIALPPVVERFPSIINEQLELFYVKTTNGYKLISNAVDNAKYYVVYKSYEEIKFTNDEIVAITSKKDNKFIYEDNDVSSKIYYAVVPITYNNDFGLISLINNQEISYEIKFVDENNGLICTTYNRKGEDLVIPDILNKVDMVYTFDKDLSNVTENCQVKVSYRPISYMVNLYDINGNIYSTEEVIKGNVYKLPTPEDIVGYDIVGWNINEKEIIVTEDVNLYPIYKKKVFKVDFVCNGEIVYTDNVEYGNSAKPKENIDIEGYIFVKWLEDYSNITSDCVINGLLSKKQFEVKLFDDEQIVKTIKVDYNESLTTDIIPEKKGYRIIGFSKNLTNIKNDIECNIVYEVITYTVNFYVDGVLFNSIKVEYNKDAILETNPVKEGYDFSNWDKDLTNVTSPMNTSAIFTKHKCLVIYKNSDGEIISKESVAQGSKLMLEEAMSIDGYNFMGWEYNGKIMKNGSIINEDIELVAKYEKITDNCQFGAIFSLIYSLSLLFMIRIIKKK